ncbi:MAG TPA: hypothetical protein VM425_12110 [Myxococcota bacterium]|nr:hypothetical protein [Myxococcota bacterium]
MKKRNGEDASPGAVETLTTIKRVLAKHAERILALAAKASRQAYTRGTRDGIDTATKDRG